MEFKYAILAYITASAMILIESQWNLNSVVVDVSASGAFILIESQWNLNEAWMVCMIIEGCILIESQWNLNIAPITNTCLVENINRITVEFK